MPLREIARKLFSYADGCTFSGEAWAEAGGRRVADEMRLLTAHHVLVTTQLQHHICAVHLILRSVHVLIHGPCLARFITLLVLHDMCWAVPVPILLTLNLPGVSQMPGISSNATSWCCMCAGKKEALANVGGLLCCNDDKLYEELRNLTIVVEGYPT